MVPQARVGSQDTEEAHQIDAWRRNEGCDAYAGLLPRACELLDGVVMRAVSPRAPFKFPDEVGGAVIVEFDANSDGVADELGQAGEKCIGGRARHRRRPGRGAAPPHLGDAPDDLGGAHRPAPVQDL